MKTKLLMMLAFFAIAMNAMASKKAQNGYYYDYRWRSVENPATDHGRDPSTKGETTKLKAWVGYKWDKGNRTQNYVYSWNIEKRYNRVDLFDAIDAAYEIRDTKAKVEGDYIYTPYSRACVMMETAIQNAIDVMDSERDVNPDDDEAAYSKAISTLNNWMALAQAYRADSVALKGKVEDLFKKIQNLNIKDSENTYSYTQIPGVYEICQGFELYYKQVDNQYTLKHLLRTVNNIEQIIVNLAGNTTLEAVNYYAYLNKKEFPATPTLTKAGYTGLDYVNSKNYGYFTAKSVEMMKQASVAFSNAIDAANAACPADPTAALEAAADEFVAAIDVAAKLGSAEVVAMAQLDEAVKFLNETCTSQYTYELLKDEIIRTQETMMSATANDQVGLQTQALKVALARAKNYNNANAAVNEFIPVLNKAKDMLSQMDIKTPLTKADYQSRVNLENAINKAEIIKENAATTQTITIEANKYDLAADWSVSSYGWVSTPKTYQNVTPAEQINAATKILNNAMNLYGAQYDFETVIDTIQDKVNNDPSLWACPKFILNAALNTATADNNQITALNPRFKQSNKTVSPLVHLADCKMVLLGSYDEAIMVWQKTIDEAMNNANEIARLTFDKENTLHYFATDSALYEKIGYCYYKFKNELTGTRDVTELIKWLKSQEDKYLLEDQDYTYLCYVIGKGNEYYKKHYTDLVPNSDLTRGQIAVLTTALGIAETVKDEYDSKYLDPWLNDSETTKIHPTHARIYFANWALDFAMQITPANVPDETGAYNYDSFEYKTQLWESLKTVACTLNSDKNIVYDDYRLASAAEVFAEAMRIFDNAYATQEEVEEASAKVNALLSGVTAIESVNAAANANSATLQNGKYVQNGKIVIVKNGKQYNAAGAQMK